MAGASIWTGLLVLFSLSSLSLSAQTFDLALTAKQFPFHHGYTSMYSEPLYPFATTKEYLRVAEVISCMPCSSRTELIMKADYKSLSRDVYLKLTNDSWNCAAKVSEALKLGLKLSYDFGRAAVWELYRSLIWILAGFLVHLCLRICAIIVSLFRHFAIPVLGICLSALFLKYMVDAFRWVFGTLFLFIGSGAQMLWQTYSWVLSFSKPSKIRISYEKAIKGFKSYPIPMNPPKSVIEVLNKSGNQAGYASCIRLYNGMVGLLTAKHCLEESEVVFRSTRNGVKIPLTEFTMLASAADTAILVGKPNWDSLMGLKAANYVTAKRLGRTPAMIFVMEKGEWIARNVTIIGTAKSFVTVLCDTTEGFSGTPYFNGKNILGVHSGGHIGHNENLMSPVPDIPGITSPDFQYETTAPQGKLFLDDYDVTNYTVHKYYDFKSKTGKNWADYTEEDDESFFNQKISLEKKPSTEKEPAPSQSISKTDLNAIAPATLSENAREHVGHLSPEMRKEFVDEMSKRRIVTPRRKFRPVGVEFEFKAGVPEMKPVEVKDPEHSGNGKSSQAPCDIKEPIRSQTPCENKEKELEKPTLNEKKDSSEDWAEKLMQRMVEKINLEKIEEKAAELLAAKLVKPQQSKSARRRANKQKTTSNTSTPSTPGKYQPPHIKSPGSVQPEKLATSTTPKNKEKANGGAKSSSSTPKWEKKSQGTGGPSSAQKPSSAV